MREKKVYPLTGDLHTALSYAVLGDAEKFNKHKHAWKVWRALKEFGCTVYPVAKDLKRWNEARIYPDLASLAGKAAVLVPCLLPEKMPGLIEEAQAAGIEEIWFQEQTWSPHFQEQCEKAGIKPVQGCVLRHKTFARPFGFFRPCYWHGLKAPKVPAKRV